MIDGTTAFKNSSAQKRTVQPLKKAKIEQFDDDLDLDDDESVSEPDEVDNGATNAQTYPRKTARSKALVPTSKSTAGISAYLPPAGSFEAIKPGHEVAVTTSITSAKNKYERMCTDMGYMSSYPIDVKMLEAYAQLLQYQGLKS